MDRLTWTEIFLLVVAVQIGQALGSATWAWIKGLFLTRAQIERAKTALREAQDAIPWPEADSPVIEYREKLAPERGVVRERPSYNHTRGDSPLTPCPECAALAKPQGPPNRILREGQQPPTPECVVRERAAQASSQHACGAVGHCCGFVDGRFCRRPHGHGGLCV